MLTCFQIGVPIYIDDIKNMEYDLLCNCLFNNEQLFLSKESSTPLNPTLLCKSDKKRTNNRRKLADLPNERYYIALNKK